MFFDPRISLKPPPFTHNPFPALVAPRPIAWVSTISGTGAVNLAPFSHFNIVSIDPPMVMFAPNCKDGSGTHKDTLRNVLEMQEFVVSVVSGDQRVAMNATSRGLRYGESEFDAVGIAAAGSINVRPPRVADSRAALECKL
jgi:flavin reductase (DIM6/NTAB) family NADH-FMN oxidoreductase RutF